MTVRSDGLAFKNSGVLTLAARQTVHALAPRMTGGFLWGHVCQSSDGAEGGCHTLRGSRELSVGIGMSPWRDDVRWTGDGTGGERGKGERGREEEGARWGRAETQMDT